MISFKYLIFSPVGVWGKHDLTKEYFVNAAKRGDLIIDVEAGKYFDPELNGWVEIKGDEK